MRILIYKCTHTGDPSPDGVFGVNDYMGRIRDLSYDAVIGVGGTGGGRAAMALMERLLGLAYILLRYLEWGGTGRWLPFSVSSFSTRVALLLARSRPPYRSACIRGGLVTYLKATAIPSRLKLDKSLHGRSKQPPRPLAKGAESTRGFA